MGMREIVSAMCATEPVRSAVSAIAKGRSGRRLLNMFSPRRGLYDSFEEAWRAAGKGRHPGHEHPEAVERHAVLADALMPSDYAILYWLEKIEGDIRLFDFGGNMGNVYYSYSRYLSSAERKLEWTVYDLPKVIDLAKKAASQRGTRPPKYSTSVADAALANVLLVSGSYHYWEGSTQSFLEQFPTLPKHVFVNRSPFYERDGRPVISMQATMNFAFPIIIRNVQEMLSGFADKNYELVDRWVAAEYGHDMPFFPAKSVRRYSGFYFRLRPASS